jgi:hypothetical protein
LGFIVLSTAIIAAIGVAFSYSRGIQGNVLEMIESNGTFLVVAVFCPLLAMAAAGGYVRALVLYKLTGEEPAYPE